MASGDDGDDSSGEIEKSVSVRISDDGSFAALGRSGKGPLQA
jgi:hypothetical protein